MTGQREHDLVRQMRMELFHEKLITVEEYTALAQERGSVERLEDYDRTVQRALKSEAEAKALRAALEAFLSPVEHDDDDCHGGYDCKCKADLLRYERARAALAGVKG